MNRIECRVVCSPTCHTLTGRLIAGRNVRYSADAARGGASTSIAIDGLAFDVELEAVLALDSVGLDQVLPVELDHLLFELGLAHRRGDATLLVSLEANRVLLL